MSVVGLPKVCRNCPQLVHFKDPHGCDEFECRARKDPEWCQEREDEAREEQEEILSDNDLE